MLSVLFAKEVLNELWAYYPAAVPILLVFYLESSTSLQVWKASRVLAHREAHDESETEGTPQKDATSLLLPKRLGLILGIVSVVYIVIILYEASWKMFFLCTLFIPFMNRVAVTTRTWYGTTHRDAIRTEEGLAIYQTSLAEGVGCLIRRSFDVLGAIVAFAALWYELPIAIAVVYASVLQFLITLAVNYTSTPKLTFRKYFWIVNGMVISFLLLVALFKLLYLKSEGALDIWQLNSWVNIITSAYYLLAPFGILSMLLRFDYANSLPITSPAPPDSTTVTSIRLSRYEIPTFPIPYFKMGFSALVVVLVGLATMPAAGIARFGLDAFGFFAAFGAAPVMVYGALGMAALNGQLRELWDYEEDWAGGGEVNLKESLKTAESKHSDSPLKPSFSTDTVAA